MYEKKINIPVIVIKEYEKYTYTGQKKKETEIRRERVLSPKSDVMCTFKQTVLCYKMILFVV